MERRPPRAGRAPVLPWLAVSLALSAASTVRADDRYPSLQGHVRPVSASGVNGAYHVEDLPLDDVHVIDVGKLGIVLSSRPIPVTLPPEGPAPLGNAVGSVNAFMSTTRDVAQGGSNVISFLSSGFLPGELVNYYLSGALAATFACDGRGRIVVFLSGGSGYLTLASVGATSGKYAAAAGQLVASLPTSPGLAVAPHAIANDGTGNFYLYGDFLPPSTAVTLRRNGTAVSTVMTGTTGRFYVRVDVPAGPDASAVYSVDAGTPGSFAGHSVEERADAGTPPAGDKNPARFFFDRSVLSSVSGGTVSAVGEGFNPGEMVTISGCSSGLFIADPNGGVGTFLTYGAVAGVSDCVLTGSMGHLARGSLLLDPNAASNVPGIIMQPARVCGSGTVAGQLARMTPNDTGSLAVDGVFSGPVTLDADGKAAFTVTKPTTGTVHVVNFQGAMSGTFAGTLLVNVNPPTIDMAPADQTLCDAAMASFSAAATGSTGVQWQVSTDGGATWTNVAGATSTTYAFVVAASDNAHYFRALFTGPCGSLPTPPALLQVNGTPAITSNPANAFICASNVVSFSVGASGGSLTYQWQVSDGLYFANLSNTAPYSGVNSPTLTITNGTLALDGTVYRCVVDNGCGFAANSSGAILTVDPTLPVVTAPAAADVTQSLCQ